MQYIISKSAEADMETIWVYSGEKWSVEQADRYFALIMDAIKYIAQYPESGIDYSFIRKGYYRAKVKSHFIFYRINKKSNLLEVIRILHQSMDIESRLND
jgi:toxin ParE1/3/4